MARAAGMRRDVRLDLVAVARLRERRAREQRAERGGEARGLRHRRDAEHRQQHDGQERLLRFRPRREEEEAVDDALACGSVPGGRHARRPAEVAPRGVRRGRGVAALPAR